MIVDSLKCFPFVVTLSQLVSFSNFIKFLCKQMSFFPEHLNPTEHVGAWIVNVTCSTDTQGALRCSEGAVGMDQYKDRQLSWCCPSIQMTLYDDVFILAQGFKTTSKDNFYEKVKRNTEKYFTLFHSRRALFNWTHFSISVIFTLVRNWRRWWTMTLVDVQTVSTMC